MTSVYRVIRFVPNAVTEEFVNVGVVAYSPDDLKARVCLSALVNYTRVVAFAGAAATCAVKAFLNDLVTRVPTGDEVERMAKRFTNSIQFTETRASLLAPDDLLRTLVPTFLGANYA